MNKKKLKGLIVIGTRPEAIKMAPLILELQKSDEIEVEICLTGQHPDLINSVLEVFSITPNYRITSMADGQSLNQLVAKMICELDPVYDTSKPDFVIVHGDTASTMAASVAAFQKKIQVFHVEAGLRTNNIYSPWPEEGNRKIVSAIAQLNFAPTNLNVRNLIHEGVDSRAVKLTGNTVIDALRIINDKIDTDQNYKIEIEKQLDSGGFSISDNRFVLLTSHRRENFGKPMEDIFSAVVELSEKYSLNFVLPVHPNPYVKELAKKYFTGSKFVQMIAPISYPEMTYLIKNSYFVMTDSGGLQEEAPYLNKAVFVLRETTERPEGVEAGCSILVGTNKEFIQSKISMYLDNDELLYGVQAVQNPYGDGSSSKKIVKEIECHFKLDGEGV